jgi:hypothetical protein
LEIQRQTPLLTPCGGNLQHILECVSICWGDVVLKTDINNKEYLELVRERQTKTRTGADIKNTRTLNPKIYATQDGRCPVALNKLYKSLRPADMCKDNGVLIYHGYLAHLYSLIFHLIVRGSTNLCRPTQGLHLLALLYIVHV